MSMLSNQKIINELKAITDSFIKTRPEMEMNAFVSSQKEPYNLGDRRGNHPVNFLKGGGSPSFQKHPLAYGSINGNTLHPDPLYSGIVYEPILNRGGAMLGENMPLEGGEYSSSEYSESDSECEGGDLMSESSEGEYSSDDEGELGAGVYSDYIKPAGKALSKGLYNVGKFALNDVILPVGKEVGKEVIKKAIMGALMGAGMKGGLSGNKTELKHILKKMYPHLNLDKMSKEEIIKKIKADDEFDEEVEFEHPKEPKKWLTQYWDDEPKPEEHKKKKGRPKVEKPVKEKKPRGRPKVEKPVKEKKPRGRPKVEKPVKEPKKKGRPSKVVVPTPTPKNEPDHLKDLDDIFNEHLNKPETPNINVIEDKPIKKKGRKPKVEGGKIKKLVGNKKGNRARGDIVAEVMKKQGLNLAQASKYVSQHNLY